MGLIRALGKLALTSLGFSMFMLWERTILMFSLVGGETFDTVHHHKIDGSPRWAHVGPSRK